MSLDQAANFVREPVTEPIDSTQTSISVGDAATFPDPASGNYNLILFDPAAGRPDQDPDVEVVRVSGRDTANDTLTVSRGREGTSAASHPERSELQLSYTAKLRDDIESGFVDASGDTMTGGLTLPSVETEKMNRNYIYAASKSGGDADARLDAALTDANDGDRIYLEAGKTYATDRTVNTNVMIMGPGDIFNNSARISGTWTWSNNGGIYHVALDKGGEIRLDQVCTYFGSNSLSGTVTVQNDRVRVINHDNIKVTFASGTSSGIADDLTNSSVTDNGSNTVGEIT